MKYPAMSVDVTTNHEKRCLVSTSRLNDVFAAQAKDFSHKGQRKLSCNIMAVRGSLKELPPQGLVYRRMTGDSRIQNDRLGSGSQKVKSVLKRNKLHVTCSEGKKPQPYLRLTHDLW